MKHSAHFYINGEWVNPATRNTLDVVNPASEEVIATIAMGDRADVDAAVAAAKNALPAYAATSKADRLAIFDRIITMYRSRLDELADIISQEVGAPRAMSRRAQAGSGLTQFVTMRAVLDNYEFEQSIESTRVIKEAIGVCALITPWNWPVNQIVCKVAPALAAGCTMVLKPSEVAPLNAMVLAEILEEAGLPAGVFNLVNGDGKTVGAQLTSHPEVDMVSFTGSTRAGVEVAHAAALTVKRVTQELGGKSANIILDDADLQTVIRRDIALLTNNSGQSCNAPTRLLVPAAMMDEAAAIAAEAAAEVVVGDPANEATTMGPVVSAAQFERVQRYIQLGIDEGAELITGGLRRPRGLDVGYYIQPTVFSHVSNEMTIAREEIFGPVVALIGYDDDDDAVRIANDTPYGLSGYVSGSVDRARAIARRLRTGNVHLNGAPGHTYAPFGGYKQSGNGRERGEFGIEEFLEVKGILGYEPAVS